MSLFSKSSNSVKLLSISLLALQLAACGGGGGGTAAGSSGQSNLSAQPPASGGTTPAGSTTSASYTISGTTTGLGNGLKLVLNANGTNSLPVSANGKFSFVKPLAGNGSYEVTVFTQPVGQVCTVTNGSGSALTANIANVGVNCATRTAAKSATVFSPYLYTGDYGYLSNHMQTTLNGTTQPVLSAMPGRMTSLTWAFATGTCGSETWSGLSGAAFAQANVAAFVAAGKKYIVSTGGAGHSFLCTSNANFLKFIQTYYSPNMIGVDFDIENGQTQAEIDSLVKVMVSVQAAYPKLRFSFTVGSYGGDTYLPISYTTNIMSAIKQYGLINYSFNLMVMDTAPLHGATSMWCTLQPGTHLCAMGLSATKAAENFHAKWGTPYSQIELTPMIGTNDRVDEVFTVADAAIVSKFAVANNLGGIHFWALSRDQDCAASVAPNDRCNSYGRAGTLGFSNAFMNGLGM